MGTKQRPCGFNRSGKLVFPTLRSNLGSNMNRFNIPKRDNYYGRRVKRNVRHKRLTDSNQQYSKAEEKLCIFTQRGIRACGKRCGMSVVQAATVMTEHEPTPRAFRLQIALLAELFVFANQRLLIMERSNLWTTFCFSNTLH